LTCVDVAIALNWLASAEQRSRDFGAAERHYREALCVARAVGDAEGLATYTGNLAALALQREDWPAAETLDVRLRSSFDVSAEQATAAMDKFNDRGFELVLWLGADRRVEVRLDLRSEHPGRCEQDRLHDLFPRRSDWDQSLPAVSANHGPPLRRGASRGAEGPRRPGLGRPGLGRS